MDDDDDDNNNNNNHDRLPHPLDLEDKRSMAKPHHDVNNIMSPTNTNILRPLPCLRFERISAIEWRVVITKIYDIMEFTRMLQGSLSSLSLCMFHTIAFFPS